MDKRVKRNRAFVKLTGLLLLAGFCSIAHAQIVVNMNVNDNQDKLTITTPGSCSNGANPNGCVKANGRQPVNFNLTGSRSCSSGDTWGSSGDTWELDYVALGMSEGSTGNLTAKAASDFNADQSTGVVTPNSQNANHIQMQNNNTAVYDVWYTVYAICGDSVIDTDPRVENDGSGRQQG